MAHSKAPALGSLPVAEALARIPGDWAPLLVGIRPRRVARMVEILGQRLGSVVLVAEAVRRRHNVSALIRTADAFGLHEVHLVAGDFQPSPGASRGSERWLRIERAPDSATCLQALKARGFRIWAADLAPGALEPEEVPVEEPVALLFGSELAGVSPVARDRADGFVRIPMLGFVESLNVSAAAAITTRAVAARRRALVGPDLDEATRLEFLRIWLEREDRYGRATRARWSGSGGSAAP
jgi:tRNA (guanosine-2'-O-)-methyltransferase